MTRTGRSLGAAALILVLLAAACSGDEPAPAVPDTAATAGMGEGHEDSSHHGHDTPLELAESVPVPSTAHDHADEDSSSTGHDHEHEDTSSTSHDHDHEDEGGHSAAGETTRYDADVADAIETITLEVVGGAPVGGHQRVEVDLGSVVAVMVTSDIAEEVHVHGYDILRTVSAGHPAHFAFNVEIPGVFEVELEGSGRLLLLMEIS